jgi:hypothetical protein
MCILCIVFPTPHLIYLWNLEFGIWCAMFLHHEFKSQVPLTEWGAWMMQKWCEEIKEVVHSFSVASRIITGSLQEDKEGFLATNHRLRHYDTRSLSFHVSLMPTKRGLLYLALHSRSLSMWQRLYQCMKHVGMNGNEQLQFGKGVNIVIDSSAQD